MPVTDYSYSNPNTPASLWVKRIGDSSWSAITQFSKLILNYRLNAAAKASVSLSTPQTMRSLAIRHGDKLRVFLRDYSDSAGNLYFEGLVPPEGPEINNPITEITAYDYISQLVQDCVYQPDYNGWEAGMAIKHIVDNCTNTPLSCSIEPINQNVLMSKHTDWSNRQNVINEILKSLKYPTPITSTKYYYCQDYTNNAGTWSAIFRVFKLDATKTPIVTLDRADILTVNKTKLATFANQCYVDGTDIVYSHTPSIQAIGIWSTNISKVGDNPEDNYRAAYNRVKLSLVSQSEISISKPALYSATLGSLIALSNMDGGTDGIYMISEKDINITPSGLDCTLTLSTLQPIVMSATHP